MIMSCESHEKLMRKSFKSNLKVMKKIKRNSRESHAKNHEKVIRNSRESHETVMKKSCEIDTKFMRKS